MILYHPYKDANHCAYRIISIMYGIDKEISRNFLNIADFYYLFPSELKNLNKWPRKNSNDHKMVCNIEDCHEVINNARMTFHEMKEIRNNTFLNLISRGIIIESTSFQRKYKLAKQAIPDSLIKVLMNDEFRSSEVYKIIIGKLSKLSLNGKSGLKAKTGLMEYRYDE